MPGIEHAFGIIGSAMALILDLFPQACASRDKYARTSSPEHTNSPRMWCAIQAALPKEAINSFDEGRKCLPPGLFGPCSHAFPSILEAKISCPDIPVVVAGTDRVDMRSKLARTTFSKVA